MVTQEVQSAKLIGEGSVRSFAIREVLPQYFDVDSGCCRGALVFQNVQTKAGTRSLIGFRFVKIVAKRRVENDDLQLGKADAAGLS